MELDGEQGNSSQGKDVIQATALGVMTSLPVVGGVYRVLRDWQEECSPRTYPSTHSGRVILTRAANSEEH